MWQCWTVYEQTCLWCKIQRGADGRLLPTVVLWQPENRNSLVYTMTSHAWFIKRKAQFIRAWFTEMNLYYVNTGSNREVYLSGNSHSTRTSKKRMRIVFITSDERKTTIDSWMCVTVYRFDRWLIIYLSASTNETAFGFNVADMMKLPVT